MTIGILSSTKTRVIFSASAKKYQTFEDAEHKSSISYSEHKLHMKKPILEMTNPEADEFSFKMTLSAFLGVRPNKVYKALIKMMQRGDITTLVIGTEVIGTMWVITDVSKAFKTLYKDGDLISCEVSVTLKEYN